jgi:AcrR family transcriptional regulator
MRPRTANPTERKPRADAQRNRLRILEMAKQEFRRSGANASLEEIARLAEVGPGTLYRHFPTRDALIEAVYQAEVGKLASAADRFMGELAPLEALRAWMVLFIDHVAAKQIIAPALNSIAGGPAKLYEGSRGLVLGAMESLVRHAVASGEMRAGIQPFDLLRALIGIAHVTSDADWQGSARRLVDILVAGSRSAPREPHPGRQGAP